MLKETPQTPPRADGFRFAIVASEYNGRYVEGMLGEARAVLEQAGAAAVEVVRVPGAFEIPVAVARLAARESRPLSSILCLGVVLRGETTHAQQIGEAVSMALMQIQIEHLLPVVHEVLLLDNEAQAQARCLEAKHNRGAEAALTAIKMARVLAELES